MDFSTPQKRPRGESIVPMINVVFLLLIFFLMTSHLAKPEPFELAPPRAAVARDPKATTVLYVGREGQLAYEETRGDAALAALAAAVAPGGVVQLRTDGGIEAVKIAALLRRLAEAGLGRVELVVASK